MNLSIGAIKSLGFRVNVELLERALRVKVITPEDVNITAGYTSYKKVAQYIPDLSPHSPD
jgi:hypothetical protein